MESVIASDKPHQLSQTLRIGGMKVRFIRSHVRERVQELQQHDVLWRYPLSDIDTLPATTPKQATKVMLGWIRKLTAAQRQALVGIILETTGKNKRLAQQLQASLSPRIAFPIWLDLETFPTASAWHFVQAISLERALLSKACPTTGQTQGIDFCFIYDNKLSIN